MLPGFVLALREGMEAALIIGIILGVLNKLGRGDLKPAVWKGALSALAVSALAALTLNLVGDGFEEQGEQLFEGLTMLLAAGVLTWMILWMRRHAAGMKREIEGEVRQAAGESADRRPLFGLAFLAVVREGVELALFLMALRLTTNPLLEYAGAGLGIAAAALLGWLLFTSSYRLSLPRFFQYTNVILIAFAAGLVGLAIREFNELGWIPALLNPVWNLDPFLPDESTAGLFLKTLVGYSSSPSLTQVIAYVGYFALLLGAFLTGRRAAGGRQKPA